MFSATAKVQVARANLVGEDDAPIEDGDDDDDADFWHTTVGKFRFTLEELPQQLQFIHQLLKVSFFIFSLIEILKLELININFQKILLI